MTRSVWAVLVLAIVGIYSVAYGGGLADKLENNRDAASDAGLTLIAYAIVASSCLCTAAILWSRDGQSGEKAKKTEE